MKIGEEYMFDIRINIVIFCMLLSPFVYGQSDVIDTSTINTNNIDSMTTIDGTNTNEVLSLDINDAIDYARRNDIRLIESQFDYEIARARKWQTTSDLYMPTLSLDGYFNYLDQKTAEGGSSSIYGLTGNPDKWGGSANISRVLFNGLRFWNNNKISEINLDMTKNTYLDNEKNVVLNTRMDFYNIFLLQENYRVFFNSDKILKQRLDDSFTKYRNGIISEYEYLTVKVQYENNKPMLISLSNSYYISKMQFIKNIGLENRVSDISLVGNIEDALDIGLPPLNEDALIQTIMQNSYDIRNMEYMLQSLEYTRKAANSYYFPMITATGGITTDYKDIISAPTATSPASLNREWQMGWQVGVRITYQLDSLIPISRPAQQAKEAKLSKQKAEYSYKNLRDNIEVQGRSLINTIVSQEASLESQKENTATALHAYGMASRQYNAGTLSLTELSDSQIAYEQAQINYLQAIYDYYSSGLQLLKLLGM